METLRHSKTKPYAYVFTVTFKSMPCAKKFRLISELPRQIWSTWLEAKKTPEMTLFFTVEYHKKKANVSGKTIPYTNNVTSPHIHGILYSSRPLAWREQSIKESLEHYYGRTQFYLQEDPEEVQGYREYCEKDVAVNNASYAYQHQYESDFHPSFITQIIRQCEAEIADISDTEY